MNYQYPNATLLIFAKAPEVGKVKTRLIPALGEKAACDLYQTMTETIVQRFASTNLCSVSLYCSPDSGHDFFTDLRSRFSLQTYAQTGRDLGEKMHIAMQHHFAHYEKVILIGTDCPAITKEYVVQALCALDDKDVVIGPAYDGGYVLIGMKQANDNVFCQVKWSSDTVLETTRQNLEAEGLSHHLLQTLHDIDVPEDLCFLDKTFPYKK